MRKQKSIKVNFIMNALLSMSSFIFPLITFPYVSRVLLPIGTGKVSFATSVVTYFAMFAQLGIPTYGIRACAKVRDDKEELTRTVHEIFIINIIMSCLAYIAFFAALFVVPKLQMDKPLFLIVGSTLIFNAIGMEWLYKALEQYSYITIRSIVFKFVALILMFLFVHEQEDYVIYGAITIVAAVGSNVFNLLNVHKYISLKLVGNYNLKRHMKAIVTFFGMSVATTIYTNLDVAMLGFMKTDEEVGYYNAAVRIKSILVSLVTSLGTVLLPRTSYYIQQGLKDEFLRITRKAINFVFLVATPMMVYFMLYAEEGIYFLSGDAYTGAIIPMQIVMPTLLFIGLSNVLGIQMLVPMGKEKVVLHSEIAGAIVDLIINILLIPQFGAVGAAFATFSAEVVVLGYQYVALKDDVRDAFKNLKYIAVFLGIILGAISSIFVKTLNVWYFWKLAISAVIFFTIYGVVLIIVKEPFVMELLGKLFSRFNRK